MSQKNRVHLAIQIRRPDGTFAVRVPCVTTGARRRMLPRVCVSTAKHEVTCPRCLTITKEKSQ